MKYEVHPVSSSLQDLVKCFWTLQDEAHEPTVKQRVLPDGCMEMIFHCADPYRQYFPDGRSIIQPRSFIFGQISNFLEIAPTGASDIIAARFQPEGLAPLLKIPVTELADTAVDLYTLFGEIGEELEKRVIQSGSTEERIHEIEQFLLLRRTDPRAIDSIAKNCVDIILNAQGQLDMGQLAELAQVNRRNMERRFVTAIGMSPKQLSRVIRLQATIKMLGQQQFTSLTALAYENGYYDQAHFIRDFKEFTDISPKSFFSENLKLASLFASGE